MRILDKYIIKKFISTFFFAILIFAVVACVIDYSEKVESFVSRNAPGVEILNYYKNFIPHITALLFPLFIFIATIFFTSKLAYKSEIIAILAGGVSFPRFLRPYLIGATLLSGLSLVANHWIVPNANKQRLAFENTYINHEAIASGDNVHLRLTKNLFVYVQSYNYQANIGYRFTAEIIDGTLLKEKVMSERISYDSAKNNWKLYDVTVRINDGIKEKLEFYPELEKVYPFKPNDLDEDDAIKEALTTPELNTYIEREKLRGRETLNFFYVEKHRRTSQPFAALILTIIGVCIASRKIRGGSGLHLALGLAICAIYILAMQLTNTYATKAILDPIVAVWIPNVLFGILALYLYRRQIK